MTTSLKTSLLIPYSGTIPSMKNSRSPVTVGSGSKRRTIFRKNAGVVKVMEELADLARDLSSQFENGWYIPDKTPFILHLHIYSPTWKIPDADGSLNTVLDALQGVLYKNDLYCVDARATKTINRNYPQTSAQIIVSTEELYETVTRGNHD